MAETSREIRRDLENTRERMTRTIVALERKVNPKHVLDEHPIAAVGLAFGTGVLLATTGSAARTGREVVQRVRHQASSANVRAGHHLDRILDSVLAAATSAITAKVTTLVEQAANGRGPGGTARNGNGNGDGASAGGWRA